MLGDTHVLADQDDYEQLRRESVPLCRTWVVLATLWYLLFSSGLAGIGYPSLHPHCSAGTLCWCSLASTRFPHVTEVCGLLVAWVLPMSSYMPFLW